MESVTFYNNEVKNSVNGKKHITSGDCQIWMLTDCEKESGSKQLKVTLVRSKESRISK